MHRHKWTEDKVDSWYDDHGWWYDCKCKARRHDWFDQTEHGTVIYDYEGD